MAFEILLAAAIVLKAVIAYWLFPDETRKWFRRLSMARQLIFGALAIIVAMVLIGSGSPLLILIGALALAWATWWLLVDEPYETLLDRF